MSAEPLQLMVKAKNGRKKLEGLTVESTISSLLHKIAEFTQIPCRAQKLLHGFPPKPLDVSDGGQRLTSLPFKSGDMLIVEEDSEKRGGPLRGQEGDTTNSPSELDGSDAGRRKPGILMRHVVPADDSCLFASVALLMEGGGTGGGLRAGELRELVATVVGGDTALYDTAFLGKSNLEYCVWIRQPGSWGGAIELSILSKFYATEIAVVDTQTARVDRFGEGEGYERRIYLIYDNVHYDPLVRESPPGSVGKEGLETIFQASDDEVLSQALELAGEARRSRQYTDLSGFTLRCLVCNDGLRGQRQAQQHAMATGHANFSEY